RVVALDGEQRADLAGEPPRAVRDLEPGRKRDGAGDAAAVILAARRRRADQARRGVEPAALRAAEQIDLVGRADHADIAAERRVVRRAVGGAARAGRDRDVLADRALVRELAAADALAHVVRVDADVLRAVDADAQPPDAAAAAQRRRRIR